MDKPSYPRYFARVVNEFWDCGVAAGERDRKIANHFYLIKRGSRWDECRLFGHYPAAAALSKLSDARLAVKSSFVREYCTGKNWRAEIVRQDENGYEIIWRNPPLSALEQLAKCAE